MSKITVNSVDFDKKIERIMKYENIEKIEKKILKSGLNVIRNETKSLLRKALPNSTKKSPLYSDRLIDGVRISVTEEGYTVIGKVHIMGSRASTSGTYRLRFFEGGTVDRVKKSNGKSTGHIDALNFFEQANNSSQNNALEVIQRGWEDEIEILLH